MTAGHEIPQRQRPTSDDGYLEQMTRSIFESGFSWEVIRMKWPAFQEAFDGFQVHVVAAYTEGDLLRLLHNPDIVRNGRKINAAIQNARTMQQLASEHGSFFRYLRTLDGLTYAERRKLLTQQFKYLGPTGLFVLLWRVDEPVPDWDERNT
ncbi:MAG: DNA-3-methyladenine glycosylase I [Chloroflexi bacterium]|nr:DNA-3-methyladenine glycosylase I [Chloroflexota bacterium]